MVGTLELTHGLRCHGCVQWRHFYDQFKAIVVESVSILCCLLIIAWDMIEPGEHSFEFVAGFCDSMFKACCLGT